MVESNSAPTPPRDILILVEKCKQGDTNAFGELVCMFRVKAYGLSLSYLKHHQDAEDVSQEAFVRAFRKIHSFDPSCGSFGSWLLKIVVNLSLNKLRWKKIRQGLTLSLDSNPESYEEDSPPFQVADTASNIHPDKQAEQSLENSRVAEAIQHLPYQQRTALHLKFVQGYKISEVANIMDIAEGTVKSHLFRGLRHLKILLGDQP